MTVRDLIADLQALRDPDREVMIQDVHGVLARPICGIGEAAVTRSTDGYLVRCVPPAAMDYHREEMR